MSDSRLRDLERRWQASGAVEDEGALLSERVRAGQLEHWTLIQMALLGNPAARFAEAVSETDSFPGAREFFENILQHDQEARATLAHYELVEEGDRSPPDTATALDALFSHLQNNPGHIDAINQMQKPVLQLIPVYKPEVAGFQRMMNAISAHPRYGQSETFFQEDLQNRWGMNNQTSGKIVGWQVAVTEGVKELSRESNRFLEKDGVVQRLEDQLSQWQEYCEQQGLKLCTKESYSLIQMEELRQAAPDTLLDQLGVDPELVTYLEDHTRQPDSSVPLGRWLGNGIYFIVTHSNFLDVHARFRTAVVVKKIL